MRSMPLRSIPYVLALGLLSAGCAQESQPSSFYLLSYSSPGTGDASELTMREGIDLGIGPVDLPPYLDRPQIVTRGTGNSLQLDEFERWGGRLNENFTTVLAEVLSSELATDRISVYPWTGPARIRYQVIVHVTAFETDVDGRSVLDARWSIVDHRRQEVLAMARSKLRDELAAGDVSSEEGADYDAVAAAMSRNVAALGRDIAAEIKSLAAE